MKQCENCQRPLNRGATSGTSEYRTCLICRTGASLATFRYVPLYAPERRGPRRKARSC